MVAEAGYSAARWSSRGRPEWIFYEGPPTANGRPASITWSRVPSRTSTRVQDDDRAPGPPQGWLGLSRPPGRAGGREGDRHHREEGHRGVRGRRRSTTCAEPRSSATSVTSSGSPSASVSGSICPTPTGRWTPGTSSPSGGRCSNCIGEACWSRTTRSPPTVLAAGRRCPMPRSPRGTNGWQTRAYSSSSRWWSRSTPTTRTPPWSCGPRHRGRFRPTRAPRSTRMRGTSSSNGTVSACSWERHASSRCSARDGGCCRRWTGRRSSASGTSRRTPTSTAPTRSSRLPSSRWDEGTGVVHLAPAFGPDDLAIGRAQGWPVWRPVADDGTFTDDAPAFVRGLFVKDADPVIVRDLRDRGLAPRGELRAQLPLLLAMLHALPLLRTVVVVCAHHRGQGTSPCRQRVRRAGTPSTSSTAGMGTGSRTTWTGRSPVSGTGGHRSRSAPRGRARHGRRLTLGARAPRGSRRVGREFAPNRDRRRHDRVSRVRSGRDPRPGSYSRRGGSPARCRSRSGVSPGPGSGHRGVRVVVPGRFRLGGDRRDAGLVLHADGRRRPALRLHGLSDVRLFGHLVAADGRKMSKSLGNSFDPFEALDRQGADALRWFRLLASGSPWEPRVSATKDPDEVVRQVLLTLWNTYAFFVTYANASGFDPLSSRLRRRPNGPSWTGGCSPNWRGRCGPRVSVWRPTTPRWRGPVQTFVDDLSNWYVRRSRRRVLDRREPRGTETSAAFATLWERLVAVAGQVLAPFLPFTSEAIWRSLAAGRGRSPGSVHLSDFPAVHEAAIDPGLDEAMEPARRWSSSADACGGGDEDPDPTAPARGGVPHRGFTGRAGESSRCLLVAEELQREAGAHRGCRRGVRSVARETGLQGAWFAPRSARQDARRGARGGRRIARRPPRVRRAVPLSRSRSTRVRPSRSRPTTSISSKRFEGWGVASEGGTTVALEPRGHAGLAPRRARPRIGPHGAGRAEGRRPPGERPDRAGPRGGWRARGGAPPAPR